DQTLLMVAGTSGRWYEAELHRLKGELLVRGGDSTAAAETCYERAIAVAARQGARPWHQRASDALASLQGAQGRPDVHQAPDPAPRPKGFKNCVAKEDQPARDSSSVASYPAAWFTEVTGDCASRCSLFELQKWHCRWSINDPGTPRRGRSDARSLCAELFRFCEMREFPHAIFGSDVS